MTEAAATVADPRRWKALAVLGVAYLMVVLDISIVNVALPSIQSDLGFTTEDLQWVVSGYALTFGGFLLLGGRAGDLLGRRMVFMVGLALFLVTSLLAGLSTSSEMLIIARLLQGAAGAILSPSVFSITLVTFAGRRRAEQGARDPRRHRRVGRRDRRAHGRRLHAVRELGVDLLRQHPDRRDRPRPRPALRAREQG